MIDTRDRSCETIERSLLKLEAWVEAQDYKGYEPFDGLSSKLHPLTGGNLFCERLLQQLVRQSPVNLRPLLGVTPKESTKGRGYMAWGYLIMLRLTGKESYEKRARACLDWLMRNKSPSYANYSWGNHFDFSSRVGKLRGLEPIIVWSSLIGQAFLQGYRVLGDACYLEVARSVCEWILHLPRERTETGSCLSYVAFEQRSIHNSNMLGAALLASVARITGESKLFEVANDAMEYSCSRQLPNGAWYYGEKPEYRWIDSFHTGYNLDSLKRHMKSSPDAGYVSQLRSGLTYFKNNFIENDGRVRYYHDRLYPIDIQCVSQAIDTLTLFSRLDPSCLDLAKRVATWAIDNMQHADGYFYYRRLPLMDVKTPMLHWGQATMYKALTSLLARIEVEHDAWSIWEQSSVAEPQRSSEPQKSVEGNLPRSTHET